MTGIAFICTIVSLLFGYLARNEWRDGRKAGFVVMFILQVLSVICVFLAIFMPV